MEKEKNDPFKDKREKFLFALEQIKEGLLAWVEENWRKQAEAEAEAAPKGLQEVVVSFERKRPKPAPVAQKKHTTVSQSKGMASIVKKGPRMPWD